MKVIYLLVVLACDSTPDPPRVYKFIERDCDYASLELSEKRAKFIIDCATAANPRSDEEGEDLVEQCDQTSRSLFCPQVAVVKTCQDSMGHNCNSERTLVP